jgi:rubredoxin
MLNSPGWLGAVGSPAAAVRGCALRPASFICRVCYFIYAELAGLAQAWIEPGMSFSALPAEWRCPDCGTEKEHVSPYVGLTFGI